MEDFLINYSGVLILVSHDRYLLDKLTEQLFIFDGRGEVLIYNGNYADYKIEQEEKLQQEKQVKNKEKEVIVDTPSNVEVKKKLSYKEQREYEALEKEIEELENEIEKLTQELGKTQDHVQLGELANDIEKSKVALDIKSERWLELAEYI